MTLLDGAEPRANHPETRERVLVGVMTAINFTHILDFVLMMPLGPRLMTVFGITAAEFSVAVGAYAISAALSALVGTLVIDRFGRRQALLWLYAGFILATVGCALAPTFWALVLARIAAGACGGLLGALVLAIVADEVPSQRRGQAMGVVMSAFSMASILGVPAGVWLAAVLDWHLAFAAVAILGAVVWAVALGTLEPMRQHLERPARSSWVTIQALLRVRVHWWCFAFTVGLVFAGFLVIPFIATFLSRNQGLSDQQLGLVYLFGGLASVVTSPLVGRWSDRWGHRQVFTVMALAYILPTLALTWLPPVGVVTALAVTTTYIVFGSGRFVPATALITSAVDPALRGPFMSLNSAVQSAATGLAAFVAGLIITQADSAAPLEHFNLVGVVASACILATVAMAGQVRPHG